MYINNDVWKYHILPYLFPPLYIVRRKNIAKNIKNINRDIIDSKMLLMELNKIKAKQLSRLDKWDELNEKKYIKSFN